MDQPHAFHKLLSAEHPTALTTLTLTSYSLVPHCCGEMTLCGWLTLMGSVLMQVSTWVPQNDVLAHSNTKAFLSHCGVNSMYEVRAQACLSCRSSVSVLLHGYWRSPLLAPYHTAGVEAWL